MALTNEELVAGMYITVLSRAPEAGESSYPINYVNLLNDGSITESDLGYAFSRSEEALSTYGLFEKLYFNVPVTTDDPDFKRAIDKFYWNAFGRLSSTEGYNYWKGKVDSNELEFYEVPVEIIKGAQDNPETSLDKTTINNKIEISIYFWQQFTSRFGATGSNLHYELLISVPQGISGTTSISRSKVLIDRALDDWPTTVSTYETEQFTQLWNDMIEKYHSS